MPHNTTIEHIAISTGILDCLQDPYDKLNNGDELSSILPDLERFAKMIIEECIVVADNNSGVLKNRRQSVGNKIRQHFNIPTV